MERTDRKGRQGPLSALRTSWAKPLSPKSLSYSFATHLTLLGSLTAVSVVSSAAMLRDGQDAVVVFADREQANDDWFEDWHEPLSEEVVDVPVPEETQESLEEPDALEPQVPFEDPLSEVFFDTELPTATWEALFALNSTPVVTTETETSVQQPLSEPEPAAAPAETAPLLLEAPAPRYPAMARHRSWEGTVVCRILVGRNGLVVDVALEQSSGFRVLDDAAVQAVRHWRFQPGLQSGREAEMEVLHNVRFRLTDES